MKRLISLVLGLVLLLCAMPVLADHRAETAACVTMDAALRQQLEDNNEDAIPIVVYMKQNADINAVAAVATDRYSAVVDTLKSTAFRSQQSLLHDLQNDIRTQAVSKLKSVYSANAITLTATPEVIKTLTQRTDIEKILYDRVIPMQDPEIVPPEQIVRPTPDGVEWNVARVGADLLWEEGITGKGITVGIIDSGVDGTHPALARKWKGYGQEDSSNYWFDAIAGEPFPYDEKTVPHGTHVTGTILGGEADGSNKIGMAPDAQWIAAKAFDERGGSLSSLLQSGDFMLNQKPDIVNNSWGQDDGEDSFFERTVESWRAAGILSVFAAGNAGAVAQEDGTINCPASYLNVIAVGATDSKDQLGDFSLLGPSPYDPTKIKPDISAPGANIRSSVPGGAYEDGWNGTSMATPAVAGVLALMKQADGSRELSYYEDVLRETATARTDERFRQSPNMGYGYGIVNAHAAVHKVLGDDNGTIKGTVRRETDIASTPALTHIQNQTTAYLSNDLELMVNARDEISVTSVKAVVTLGSESKEYPLVDIAGDHRDGTYRVRIPREDLVEGDMQYYFVARNFQDKEIKTDTYHLTLKFGIEPGYTEDFESEPQGWQWNNDWEWGKLAKEPYEAHSGEHVMATKLATPYSNFKSSRLVTPPIDLREVDRAYLSFYHWYQTPEKKDSDMAEISISVDGGENWMPLDKQYRGNGKAWTQVGINLSEYGRSKTPVYIAFDFATDILDNGIGWIIDDVALKLAAEEAPADVTGLKLDEVTMNYAEFSWNPSTASDVDYYIVSRYPEGLPSWSTETRVNGVEFVDYTIDPNRTYCYEVYAVNFAGIRSAESEILTVKTIPAEPYLKATFNSLYTQHFIAGGINNDWEYGVVNEWDPTNHRAPAKPQTGEYVWGTNLKGEYAKRANSYIQNETPFDIPTEGNAYLEFCHWYEIEDKNSQEFGEVQISVDGGETWQSISRPYHGDKKSWDFERLSLNEFRGKNNVLIRFAMHTDSLFQYSGWYISKVIAYSLPETAPTATTQNVSTLPGTVMRNDLAEVDAVNLVQTVGLNHAFDEAANLFAPLEAKITVVETAKSTTSSARNGSFLMIHPSRESMTLRASAYGYEDQDQRFSLASGEEQIVNFLMTPKAKESISGRVVDATSKEPIHGARVRLREDARVKEVYTDEDGRFVIPQAYVGDYTVVVNHPDYLEQDNAVIVSKGAPTEQYFEMRRFVGFESEMSHDDNSGENAILLGKGVGNVVQFDVDEYVKVSGMKVFFWGEDWPVPGGTETSVAILRFDENGKPLDYVDTPKVIQAKRGEWNNIDLSDFDFGTSQTFGLAVIQTTDNNLSPAVAVDTEGSPFVLSNKSFAYSDGAMVPLERMGVKGNLLIRAIVKKSLENVTIENLQATHYTNKRELPVVGSVDADCEVALYVDGIKVATLPTENKRFETTIPVIKDQQTLQASVILDGKESELNDPIKIIFDDVAPELRIDTPTDRAQQSDRYLLTEGRVFDANFANLTINDEAVDIRTTGSFSHELILNNGEHIIRYKATDKAGNVTEMTRRVMVGESPEQPQIRVLSPEKSTTLLQGHTLHITAEGDAGKAYYQLSLSEQPATDGWHEMTADGNSYRADWQAPENVMGEFFLHVKLVTDYSTSYVATPYKVFVTNHVASERLAGGSRFDTAFRIAESLGTCDKAYLVNAERFVDAAVVGPLAKKEQAPVLLSYRDALPKDFVDRAKALGIRKIVLVGGELVLSDGLEETLHTAGFDTERIAGATRYLTALEVARAFGPAEEAILASGENVIDAISVGSYDRPILLTAHDHMKAEVKHYLDRTDHIVIVGGHLAVDPAIEAQFTDKTTRLQGGNRYSTNLEILNYFAQEKRELTVANGETGIDALSAAVLDRPVFLTNGSTLDVAQQAYLTDREISDVLFLGGTLAINETVERQILELLEH